MGAMQIVIEDYRESAQGAYEVAVFDVYFPEWELTIKKVKLIKSKQGKYFPSIPSFCTDDGMGNKTWTPYFSFSETLGREFRDKVMKELKGLVPALN